MTSKPLRADARRNYDQLIAAASHVFAEHGAAASLEEIARRAGVGIGTLYRHFPTRDDLIAALLYQRNAQIIELGDQLRDDDAPYEALTRWLEALIDHNLSYQGLSALIAPSFQNTGSELCTACSQISAAGKALIERAKQAGELAADVDPDDVILGANAAAWAAEQTRDRRTGERMLATFLAGLRSRQPPAKPRVKKAARARSARASK